MVTACIASAMAASVGSVGPEGGPGVDPVRPVRPVVDPVALHRVGDHGWVVETPGRWVVNVVWVITGGSTTVCQRCRSTL